MSKLNKNKLQLSIIIINYNTKKITIQCLQSVVDSLRDNKISYEIILIDNASSDSSFTYFSNFAALNPQVRYIYNKKNLGFGKANNQGLRLAKGKYILLLNSDTIILNRAINRLLNYYKKHENKVHFLGPKLLNKDFSPQSSAGYFFNLLVVFEVLFLKGDKIGLTRFSPSKVNKVDWVSGACLLTKKEIIEKIRGFDEKIFMYMDEVDLLYRANKISYSVYFYPQAKVIHYGSASSSKTYPIWQLYRGLLYFYKKHYSATALFLLKVMLYLKGMIAITIGKILKNNYLKEAYSQAIKFI